MTLGVGRQRGHLGAEGAFGERATTRHLGIVSSLLVCLFALQAQTPTATVVGSVIDPAEAPVPGASVEIRNAATNQTARTQSDRIGEFLVPNLAPGIYDVIISKAGFRTLRQTGLALQVNQQVRDQFRLQLGELRQTVDVAASVPLVNTETAVKGDVVVSQEIMQMPLDGRDLMDLALLTGGVLPMQQGGIGSGAAINGARADNTNFVVDGFNNQSPREGTAVAKPNIDAMEEFKVETTGYSAESGRLAGGVMSMALKTGGNALHGSLFEYLRNDLFDARNFFDRAKGAFRRNQFGAMANGPVLIPRVYDGRNRTFFLFSWESFRQRLRQSALAVVPTDAQRLGNFSTPLRDPLATGTCSASSVAACFPGNRIPASRLSPVAMKAQAFYPLENRVGQVNNLYASASAPNDWDSAVIKFDHRFSPADALSFRLLKRYGRSTYPYNPSNLGTFGLLDRGRNTLAGLTYTKTVSPTLINEARVGLTRLVDRQFGRYQGTDYHALLGMTGGPTNPKLVGFPYFAITSLDGLGEAAGLPTEYTVNTYQFADTFTRASTRHVMKFGGEMLRVQFFQPRYANIRGTYNFTGSWTGQPFADFLLGLPNSTTRSYGTTDNYLFANNFSAFFQDDWKLSRRVTLNLGLRYELPMPPHDKYGRWMNFVPEYGKAVVASLSPLSDARVGFTNPAMVATARDLGLPDSLVYPTYKNFAPRFGIAWRPFGGSRSVVRGGYGIYYGAQEINNVRVALANIFPYVVSQTVNRIASNPQYLTLANPFPVAPTLTSNLVNANGYQLHAPTPYLQSWNLTLERDLGRQSALEIGYTGSKGTHLGRYYNLNQPFRSAATAPNFPVPYPGWSSIAYYGFHFNSSYNSANITLRRRFAHGVFYRVSYVYAKSIDYASQLANPSAGGYGGFQDARNFRGERGRSDWDIRHSFTTSFSWETPWKRNLLVRGWQLSGTGAARTGAPFTPQVSNVNLNLGEANRPNRVATGTVPSPSPDRWYDVSAFPAVSTGSFAFGSSGRNILNGPGAVQMNLSLSRDLRLGEGRALRLRWEVFNSLNKALFRLPVVNVNAPNAATITAAGDPRRMQLGLQYRF